MPETDSKASNVPETGSKAGSELATKGGNFLGFIGKLDAIWDIIVGVFFGIICLCISIYLFRTEDAYGNNKIKGTVKNSLCNKHYTRKNRIYWDCSFNIMYNIDNNEYLKSSNDLDNLDNSKKKYTDGDLIDLRYNPNNKNDITTIPWTYKKIAMVLMIISFFLIVIPIAWYILITRNKTLATVAGGITVAKGIF